MKKIVIFCLALIVGLVMTGDGFAGPKRGGTLIYGIPHASITVGVDPHVIQGDRTIHVLGQIVEGLLSNDQSENIVPWLAKSWDISADGKTYTFHLEKGVKFHNGREMVAEDVKFSFERILKPETGSRRRQNLELIDTITALDQYTVQIRLKTRFSPFLTYLVGVSGGIIPRECVDADGKITHPMGTGPFKFVEWVKNDHLTVRRFDDYWKKERPYLDEIIFKPLPDEAVRMTALRTGAVDIIPSVSEKLLPKLMQEGDKRFNLLVQPGVTWFMLILNNKRPPFNDVKLRQAVSFAIDREEIMQALTNGFGKVVNDIWDEKSFWYMPFPVVQRDLAKVKTLLKAAGHENGLDVTLHVKPAYLNVAQVVQDQLNKAQIRTKLVVLDWVSMKPKLLKNEFDMAVSSAGGYADPDGRYGRFYAHDGPANYFAGGYANPKVDELLEKGREEVDPKRRKEIYTEVWKIVEEEVPHVILYMAPMTHAWRKRVQDFRVSVEGDIAFDGGGLAYVWLSE